MCWEMNHIKGKGPEMTLTYRYVVFVNNARYSVEKGEEKWEELRLALRKKRYCSNLMVWRPFLNQWKCIPNIPFFMDVRLPKGFLLMLGPSFRNPLDIGHELSVYLQTLEWIEKQKLVVRKAEKNKRRAFWQSQHLRLLMPPASCLSAPFRDGWFENDDQHYYLNSYSLELMHHQINPRWDWIKSWFKSQFDFSICCAQKKLPESPHSPPSILIQDLYPVRNIKQLVHLAHKHLKWRTSTPKTIEHLFLHNGCATPLPPDFHVANIHLLSPFHLFQVLQSSKRVYRSHLLPCTELLTIGLSVSGADVYLPNSFSKLDPQFQIDGERQQEPKQEPEPTTPGADGP